MPKRWQLLGRETMSKKYLLGAGLVASAFLMLGSTHNVFAEQINFEDSEAVVKEYFNSMGTDWNQFAELYTDEQSEGFKEFLNDSDNVQEKVGVLNVNAAMLKDVVEIKLEDADNMLAEDYDGQDVKVYAVGADFQVKQDSKYFSNGTSYYLLSLVNQNDQWKVNELAQIAEPGSLLEKGYTFNDEYAVTEDMIEARQAGYLMNGEGEIFADIDGNPVEATPYAILNKRTVPTDSTTISYGTYTNGVYKSKQSLKFHDYCLGVSAGEVKTTTFDGAARQAVNVAIKTYTWHYKIVPIDSAHGVDIKNTMQAYKPNDVSINKKVTTDYNAVKDVWMESNSGAIFEALYGAGSYNDAGKEGGRLMQNGCRYLVSQGKSLYGCLHYYYDNSTASSGGAIRFFDSNKNEI